jgi:hypothetical protein
VNEWEKLTAQLTGLRERLVQVDRDIEQDAIALLDDPKARTRLAVLVVDSVALPYQIAELDRRAARAEIEQRRVDYAAAIGDWKAAGVELGPLVAEFRAIEQERKILINRLGPSATEVLPLSERMAALQSAMGPVREREAEASRRADEAVNAARRLGVELR